MSAGASAVERWTPKSRIAVAAAAVIIAVLAVGPAIFSANAVDKLTTLFIYVILALMWNALVGFCGLVSIGQQAFFGLGAYAAIRLADLGVSVYPSLFLGALIVGVAVLARCRSSCSGSRAANSPSACGWCRNWRTCSSISTRWCAAKPALR